MTSRERFLAACACQPLERPPIWLMRQAGRDLPEYRALKQKYSFLELVRTPALAAEITLQPLRRFAFDAAILFSDILVVPEALGQSYRFPDDGGIVMDFALATHADVERLAPASAIAEKLSYVGQALALLKQQLAGRHALLGFGGAPWTLACYMLEGGSSENFPRAQALFQNDRAAFDALMEKLTAALIEYFRLQIRSGADAIQIFDSWAGLAAEVDYENASLRWIRTIIAALPRDFPVILFAKGVGAQLTELASTGAHVISLDSTVDMRAAHKQLAIALQGNLDPRLLTGAPELVRDAAAKLLASLRGTTGHIFNLGHGITPNARIDCIEALVETVIKWKN
ncbi:MAG: uroporphyrinogen decarboxylase [Verrucomicrobiota bacterium]|nr:uroporphyrinogen decarboxylase [Verrucomicrobiota bacterium]